MTEMPATPTFLPTTQFLAQALLRNPSPPCLLRASIGSGKSACTHNRDEILHQLQNTPPTADV